MVTLANVGTLKVSELKAELSKRGLETKGIKSALQKRLRAALEAAAAPAATGMEVESKENDETIDESVRFKGTVVKFFKRRGFGTICPEGKDATKKEDLVFVHWRQIQSSDEWPSLNDGQVVEYYLGEKTNPRKPSQKIFAAKVTGEGGNPVSQTDDRVFPDRSQRFQGVVKFFDARKGFGFVKPKEDFCFDEQDFVAKKAGIYVCREDIKTADSVDTSPSLKDKAEIEFTLYKKTDVGSGKSKYCAGDVTKVGGEPLTAEDFKPRGVRGPRKGGKNGKRKFNKMANMKQLMKAMKGMNMPMMNMMGGMPMMGGGMPMFQMGGQSFMMMPNMGGKKKRRRKNKKNKN